jgi:protein-S-isoprenylcysteine O-methyltransferase Ste14
MTTQTTLGRRVALAAVYGERYVVSLILLGLAAHRLHGLVTATGAERAEIQAAPFSTVIREIVWSQLTAYCGLLLLVGRRVRALPEKVVDIVLPMATTFFYVAYNVVPWLPAGLRRNLCAPEWQGTLATASLVLNLAGLWIAMWAAVYLGRSFGVLIEVRQVVLEGVYKWVRHPMYSGYLLLLVGLILGNFSVAYWILVPLHIGLTIYRARLEENRLAACSVEYAAYRKQTGFLFPRLFRAEEPADAKVER